jgi:hypothetical protein
MTVGGVLDRCRYYSLGADLYGDRGGLGRGLRFNRISLLGNRTRAKDHFKRSLRSLPPAAAVSRVCPQSHYSRAHHVLPSEAAFFDAASCFLCARLEPGNPSHLG